MAQVIEDREALPLLALRSAAPLPGATLPVELGRAASVGAVRRANAYPREDPRHNRLVIAVQEDPLVERPHPSDLRPIAVVGVLEEILHGLPGRMTVLMRAGPRVRIVNHQKVGAYAMVTFEPVVEANEDSPVAHALAHALKGQLEKHDELLPVKAKTEVRRTRMADIKSLRSPGRVADVGITHIDVEEAKRIEALLELDVEVRLRLVLEAVSHAAQTLQVQRDIDKAVREHLSRHEHEHVLRHKMRAIQAELDDGDSGDDLEDLQRRLAALELPEDIQDQVTRQLRRMSQMNPQSSEANVTRTWLELVADLPWREDARTVDRIDIAEARERLEAEHHGLERVKKRVIEYLCVRKLAKGRRGPILCLAGPPGVGKTSLAKSIASTLGREFIRISLGGVRDDAEIRGHRRTYVGAQPGRFIAALRRAKVKNPLILLDELDKLGGAEMRGDPASALLEALDPEQNDAFEDHYLGSPFDLSEVIFICTANDIGRIPGPLRDRLEIIEISGYTVEEKVRIAREHLLPRERKNHGLEKVELEIPDAILESLSNDYTRESGVRNLQRSVAALLRHVAMELAEHGGSEAKSAGGSIEITEATLDDALGPPRYLDEGRSDVPRVGVVTGLGWTPTGGRLLMIEATRTAGEGRLRLTGRLGEVMKESAQAAQSLLRASPERFGLTERDLRRDDVHVHLPAGAVPKDGPSAGVGLVTALASVASGRPVRNDIAMTGEITLRGQVLPVGGIREKVLAAHRAGIFDIILPDRNRKDEPHIPEAARKDLRLHFVKHIDEVLELALLDAPARANAS